MITRLDPTRTTTLRKKYMAEMRRRFYAVRSLVIQAIWKLDVLGLMDTEPMTFLQQQIIFNQLPARQAWRFRTNSEKLGMFRTWLQEQIDMEILSVNYSGLPWNATYIQSAYRQGVMRAYADVHREVLAKSQDYYEGSRSQFLRSSFNQPERLSKLQFLYTRSFEELRGITAVMSQQMGRILANGIAEGQGAATIARELRNNISQITRTRAILLARTELIAAHAEGQLDAFDELGIEEIGVMAEWSTAGDDLVCELCGELEGAIMTVEEARGLIPRHPNCRCAWIPAMENKSKYKGKVKASLKAGLPMKTRAGDKVAQTIEEASRRSTWAGKELL